MIRRTIYLAGPLFGIADRHRNLLLAKELESLSYEVILPQKEALKFFNEGKFDLKGIREGCCKDVYRSEVIVANIDGPSADDGTAIEVGIAILAQEFSATNPAHNPHARLRPLIICVRTDFRTAMDREVGINGMFGLANKIIYKPAFINSLKEAANFYRELALEIDGFIIESKPKE